MPLETYKEYKNVTIILNNYFLKSYTLHRGPSIIFMKITYYARRFYILDKETVYEQGGVV